MKTATPPEISDDEHSEKEIYYPDELEFQEENEVVASIVLNVPTDRVGAELEPRDSETET